MAWLTGWTHREKLTIQHAHVDSALTDFSVCVKLSADADYSDALATGADIRFTDSDGETLLKHEMESWVGGGGGAVTADFWVKLPSISAVAGTDFYVYWEKADAADAQDAANVWDANYEGVWHLHQGDSTAAGFYTDSSGNAHHGTLSDADGDTVQADGKVSKCLDFAGDADYIGIGTVSLHATLNTIEAWIRSDSVPTTQRLFVQGNNNYGNNLSIQIYSSAIRGIHGKDGGGQIVGSSQAISSDTWYHVAYAVDDGANESVLYINGLPVQTDAANTIGTAAYIAAIAAYSDGSNERFNGDIDEVRLSVGAARSAAWIKFTYHNIAEADNELTWGGKETASVAGRKAPILGGGIGLGV